jgi:hypothetical protein
MLKNVTICFILFAFPTGCSNGGATAEKQCVQNLAILNLAAKSYSLERGIANSAQIAPSDLAGFLKGGRIPTCPLGSANYPPFTLSSGPNCPNSSAHTAKFKQLTEKQTGGTGSRTPPTSRNK